MAKPWAEIEREYITTTIGQRGLAEKYGVTTATINNHAKKGEWLKKRKKYMKQKVEVEPEVEIVPGEGWFTFDLDSEWDDLKPHQKYKRYKNKLLKIIPGYNKDDPLQVRNRINSYLQFCNENDIAMSPTDLAKWLKIGTASLRRWRNGEYRRDTHQSIIEDAFDNIEADLINAFRTGATNPTTGIFLLKNWFGYKDVQDIAITPKNPNGELVSKEELERRILGTVVLEEGEEHRENDCV